MTAQCDSYKREKPFEINHTQITVDIPTHFVVDLYEHAIKIKQEIIKTHGFERGKAPLLYVQKNYQTAILDHVTEVLFIHYAYDNAVKKLYEQKGTIVADPLLTNVILQQDKNDNSFAFSSECIIIENKAPWKQLRMKFPLRKRYKDLDKQAETFALQERTGKVSKELHVIAYGDWVQFNLILMSNELKPLLDGHQQLLWIRMSNEDVDRESSDLFLGKKKNESFVTNSIFLNKYIAPHGIIRYTFKINIVDVVPHAHFCIDTFQQYFSLKSNKDICNKLIEVFSFRNDVTLRREMMQVALNALAKNYHCSLPARLVDEQRKNILARIVYNPDYLVYQAQKDFLEKISLLAERQVLETILADHLAKIEHIEPKYEDILLYMGIIQRPRLRDFIYFDLPMLHKNRSQECPIPHTSILVAARREKALNHVLSYLVKNN